MVQSKRKRYINLVFWFHEIMARMITANNNNNNNQRNFILKFHLKALFEFHFLILFFPCFVRFWWWWWLHSWIAGFIHQKTAWKIFIRYGALYQQGGHQWTKPILYKLTQWLCQTTRMFCLSERFSDLVNNLKWYFPNAHFFILIFFFLLLLHFISIVPAND